MRIYSRKKKGARERSWYIDYRDPVSGRRIRKVCGRTRHEAERARAQIESTLLGIGNVEPEPDNPPFFQFVQEYITHRSASGIAPSTLTRYRRILQNFVDYVYKEKPVINRIGNITTKDIWDYIHYRKKDGKKNKTIWNEIDELKRCFRYAVEIGAIKHNPSQKVHFTLNNESSSHFFSKDELKQIFEAMKNEEWLSDIFKTFLYTGMRKGELMHLQWRDVDLDRQVLHVRYQVVRAGKVIYNPKTKSSARVLPLNDEVIEILKRQKRKGLNKDHVFVNQQGRPFNDGDLYYYLRFKLGKLGIKGSIHTFRHTFASLLIEAGVGLRELKDLMGHSSIESTMRYAHLYPQRLHEQVNRLTTYLAGNVFKTSETSAERS